jgi:hypothetical protein
MCPMSSMLFRLQPEILIDLTFGDCSSVLPFINCLFPFNRHLNLPLHINCWNPTGFGPGLSGIERKNASLVRPLLRVALPAYFSLPEFGDHCASKRERTARPQLRAKRR